MHRGRSQRPLFHGRRGAAEPDGHCRRRRCRGHCNGSSGAVALPGACAPARAPPRLCSAPPARGRGSPDQTRGSAAAGRRRGAGCDCRRRAGVTWQAAHFRLAAVHASASGQRVVRGGVGGNVPGINLCPTRPLPARAVFRKNLYFYKFAVATQLTAAGHPPGPAPHASGRTGWMAAGTAGALRAWCTSRRLAAACIRSARLAASIPPW